MNRLKEQGQNNAVVIKHDAVGNYLDMNGIRLYMLTIALTDGLSTAAPRGSVARTSHATGKDRWWESDGSAWQQGDGSGDIPAVAATGAYTFLRAPLADEVRVFNGVSFSWKVTPSTAVQAQLVTEDTYAPTNPNDTLLGHNLYNMVAKLNASADGSVNVATYSTDATGGYKNATEIIVTYDTAGLAGNAYTLDSVNNALSTRSGATLTGGVDALSGYKTWRVNVTQATTDAPTATEQLNELGGADPTFLRTAAGIYTITKVGAFPAAKTFLGGAQGSFNDGATKMVVWSTERTSDDVLTLRVKEITFTAANNVVLADKEISAMTTPIIPLEVLVKN